MIKQVIAYYRNSSLRVKINISIVGAAGIILLVLLTIVSVRSRSIVLSYAENTANSTGKENAYRAVEYVNKKQSALRTLTSSFESQAEMLDLKFDLYKNIIKHIAEEDSDIYAIWYVENFKVSDTSQVQKYIFSKEGGESANHLLEQLNGNFGYEEVKSTGDTWVSDPFKIGDKWYFDIAVPMKINEKVVGAVGFVLHADFLSKVVNEAMTSEGILCKIITGTGIIAGHFEKERIGVKNDEGVDTERVLERIKKNEEFSDFVYSITLKDVAYKVYVPITFEGTKYTWSFCTVVSSEKMLHETKVLAILSVLLMIIGIVILIYFTNIISKKLTKPIVDSSQMLKLIADGRLNEVDELKVLTNDEIGEMVSALNQLTASQKHLAYFASEIGHGNLEVNLVAKGDSDIIGKAMVDMRQDLINAHDAEMKRKHEDDVRNWKINGNARIHELIRKESNSIKHLCTTIIQEIISYSDAIQGGVFIIDDENSNEQYVDLVASIAYSRIKMMQKRMPVEEGLIGRCIFEKAPIILKEIPQDYLSITSGLGDRNPDYLAIIPLINNDVVVGVIEIASFKVLDTHVVEYLTKSAESLASAIANVKINERTQRLLEQTKLYAEESSAQEEELRQNMEEMQAAQEEMYRKTMDYENTISQLKDELDKKE